MKLQLKARTAYRYAAGALAVIGFVVAGVLGWADWFGLIVCVLAGLILAAIASTGRWPIRWRR